jgi:hypothetical protein
MTNTIGIKPISLGLPAKTANRIMIRPIISSTQALDCNTYYEVVSRIVTIAPNSQEGGEPIETVSREVLASGNFAITEEQYLSWGADNSFIEDIVIAALGLEREAV